MKTVLTAVLVLATYTVAEAKSVVLDQGEFVTIVANVEVLKKRLANAEEHVAAQRKGLAERDQIIKLQKTHIDKLETALKKANEIEYAQKGTIDKLQAKKPEAEHGTLFILAGLAALAVLAVLK